MSGTNANQPTRYAIVNIATTFASLGFLISIIRKHITPSNPRTNDTGAGMVSGILKKTPESYATQASRRSNHHELQFGQK